MKRKKSFCIYKELPLLLFGQKLMGIQRKVDLRNFLMKTEMRGTLRGKKKGWRIWQRRKTVKNLIKIFREVPEDLKVG
jgi:hypothetical protein